MVKFAKPEAILWRAEKMTVNAENILQSKSALPRRRFAWLS